MPQQTPAQARVLDPILTTVARGYRGNAAPVADVLFPRVSVGQRGGQIIVFGPDDFRRVSTARAPGANTPRVQFGYGAQRYALVDYSLEGAVPIELQAEAAAVPGINLQANAVRRVRNQMDLEREMDAARLAREASSYPGTNRATLANTDQWSHETSQPAVQIAEAKEVVRSQIGVRPNVLIAGPKALTALKTNPSLLAKISDADDKILRTEQIARYLEVDQVVEGGAIWHDGKAFHDVWGADAVLAYTAPASMIEMGSPNYGYTYVLEGYPFAEEGYFDRNTKTWYYPVTDSRQAVLAGPTAAFLFKNAAG